jgi:hypothetical protein
MKTVASVLLFLVIFATTNGNAQALKDCDKNKTLDWEIGANLGFTQYYGDISNKSYFRKFTQEIRFGGNLFGRAIFNQLYGFGLGIGYYSLASEKDSLLKGNPLNYGYNGTNFQFGAHAYLNLTNLFWGVRPEGRVFNLYSTAGLSYISWKGTLSNTINNSVIVDDGVNALGLTFSNSSVVIPLTMGIGIQVSENLRLNFEGSIQTVMSDDLDYYKDGFKNDIILFSSVGLSYHFRQIQRKKSRSYRPTGPEVIEYDFSQKRPQPASFDRNLPVLEFSADKSTAIKGQYEFRVQIIAMSKSRINMEAFARRFKIETPVIENTFSGLYRYSTGRFNSFREAEAYSKVIRGKGIHDAFVVAYRANERIPITEEMKKD